MGSLGFLFPAFLGGMVAAAVPIAMHLFKRDRTLQVPFSAVRFLQHVPIEHARRRRLREWLVLALRVLAIVLLAVAFARPFLIGSAAGLSRSVFLVLVDTSGSMSAPGQLEKALKHVAEAIDRAGANELTGIISFADRPAVVLQPSADRRAARQILATLRPGAGGTRYDRALEEAVTVMGNRGGRILLVTDLQRSGWSSSEGVTVPSTVRVDVFDVGMASSNLAVSAMDVHRGGVRGLVRNTGAEPRDARIKLTFNDGRLAEQAFSVPPWSSREVMFDVMVPPHGFAWLEVDDAVGPVFDNARFAVLDPRAPIRVLLTTSGGRLTDALYLERALAVGEAGFEVEAVRSASLADVALDKYRVLGILATTGLERRGGDRLAEYVKAGGGLLIAAGPHVDFAVFSAMTGLGVRAGTPPERGRELSVIPVDVRHPVFESFARARADLGRIRVRRHAALTEEGHVLARFDSGAPALMERRFERGHVILFASDLNNQWNDFPVRSTFLPFIHEVVRHLAANREPPREYTVAGAPSAAGARPGVHVLRGATFQQRIAVNVDNAESDLERMTTAEFVGRVARSGNRTAAAAHPAFQGERQQKLWRLAIALMVLGLVGESIVARRPA